MTTSTFSVSVVINAPVEQVWSLLIEHQPFERQEMMTQKYIQRDPAGPFVAGQVIHVKAGPLHLTTYIKHVEQADPPYDGQTIFARITFLGKDGESVSRWFHDAEHHHIHTQEEVKHPWCAITGQTNTYCIAIDTTSCVVVSVQQSEMTIRLMPRWLKRRLDTDKAGEKSIAEAYFHRMKEKAEQTCHQARME